MEDNFGSFFKWCNANGIFVGRNGDGPKADFEFCFHKIINEDDGSVGDYSDTLILDYCDVIADYLHTKSILKTYFNIGG